ncbi:sodium/potassium/calcium exchanger 2-like [Corticium candelabrum]|uniref:sodium/potassium/calcium exchanger 2-like n=1 Tax=Corticium candelabrum TaxID=121492 RepID=UPI002E25772D|nr:sodium/potassium/calcium exchanger 2-like [Corticium candelabrum]
MRRTRRSRSSHLLFGFSIILSFYAGASLIYWSKQLSREDDTSDNSLPYKNHFFHGRHILVAPSNHSLDVSPSAPSNQSDITDASQHYWPNDVFSLTERRRGAVLLHICGVIYVFVALAIVCDEFFVPALNVITVKLNLRKDVAGATFMAAGGSAPELFTSLFGVFIANTNVGFGTIVGSAVFNVLFVIGMCAVVSKSVLNLSWWPLFRDCLFYSVALALLIGFYSDSEIELHEAAVLCVMYVLYVVFMVFNGVIERWVKSKVRSDLVQPMDRNKLRDTTFGQVCHQKDGLGSQMFLKGCGVFRQGAVHLMLYALDPLAKASHEGHNRRLAELASLQVTPRVTSATSTTDCRDQLTYTQQDDNLTSHPSHLTPKLSETSNITLPGTPFTSEPCDFETTASYSTLSPDQEKNESQSSVTHLNNEARTGNAQQLPIQTQIVGDTVNSFVDFQVPQVTIERPPDDTRSMSAWSKTSSLSVASNHVNMNETRDEVTERNMENENENSEEGNDEDEEPLDVRWPKTFRRRVMYILLVPIVLPLYFTLPDVRHENKRRFYPWTFIGSTGWIAAYSYLMVWWANQVGETIGISPEVMGLTFLAAGTSIPDLITSVIVARQGHGDMAVSSSIGSNMFDVTVGLPIPWLLAILIRDEPVDVVSKGLFCSISLLFGMLVILVISIIICRWRMNRTFGIVMFVFYFIFLSVSILLETETIGKCSVGSS